MKIYIKSFCPYCIRLIQLLDLAGITYETIDVWQDLAKQDEMYQNSHQSGVPQVEMANIIIPDYIDEESLVKDIELVLWCDTVDVALQEKLTSTIVYLS